METQELKKGADKEHFEFWTNAAETAQANGDTGIVYDASIFNGPKIDGDNESNFTRNSSYVFAALQVYQMSKTGALGFGRGSIEKLLTKYNIDPENLTSIDQLDTIIKGMSPSDAKKFKHEVVDYGRDTIGWFHNNIAATGGMAARLQSADPEQQKAFLYLMHTAQHTKMLGFGQTAKFVTQGLLTDPTQWLSLAAGFVTAGTGTAGITAARMAAVKGSIGAIELMVEKGVSATVGRVVGRTFAKDAAERIIAHKAGKGVYTATMKGLSKRLADSQVAYWGKGHFVAPAMMGMALGALTNAPMQQAEIAGNKGLGIDRDFSITEFGISAVMGAGMNAGLGASAGSFGAFGNAATSGIPRTIKPTIDRTIHATTGRPTISFSRWLASQGAGYREAFNGLDRAARRGIIADYRAGTGTLELPKPTHSRTSRHGGSFWASIIPTRTAPAGQIIPDDSAHFLHMYARFLGKLRFDTFFQDVAKYVPNDLYIKDKIRPAMKFIDEALDGAGIIDPIRKLSEDVERVMIQTRDPLAPLDIRTAKLKIDTLLTNFKTRPGPVGPTGAPTTINRATDVAAVNAKIDTLLAELADPNKHKTYKLGAGVQMGFDPIQKQMLVDYLTNIKVRMKNLMDYDPALVSATPDGLKAIDLELYNTNRMFNEAQQRLDAGWHDMGLIPPKHLPKDRHGREIRIEDLDRIERGIVAGVFLSKNRERIEPSSVMKDNTEKVFFNMLERFKEIKGNDWGVSPTNEFEQDLQRFFDWGLEEHGAYLMRLLALRQGGSGRSTFPLRALQQLKTSAGASGDARNLEWADILDSNHIKNLVGHNNMPGAQRSVLKEYVDSMVDPLTARMFAGGNRIATPSVNKWYKLPVTLNFPRRVVAYLWGTKTRLPTTEEILDDKMTRRILWLSKEAPEGTTGAAKWTHNAKTFASDRAMMLGRWITLPLFPGYSLTKNMLKNRMTWRIVQPLAAAGIGLHLAEEGLEAVAPEDWKDENGNLPWDVGSRINGLAISLLDFETQPLRQNFRLAREMPQFVPIYGPLYNNGLTHSVSADYISADYTLGEINKRYVFGDRGDGQPWEGPWNEGQRGSDEPPIPGTQPELSTVDMIDPDTNAPITEASLASRFETIKKAEAEGLPALMLKEKEQAALLSAAEAAQKIAKENLTRANGAVKTASENGATPAQSLLDAQTKAQAEFDIKKEEANIEKRRHDAAEATLDSKKDAIEEAYDKRTQDAISFLKDKSGADDLGKLKVGIFLDALYKEGKKQKPPVHIDLMAKDANGQYIYLTAAQALAADAALLNDKFNLTNPGTTAVKAALAETLPLDIAKSTPPTAASPAVTPSGAPVVTPSGSPVVTPSGSPVVTPSGAPVVTPSGSPVVTPSGAPVTQQGDPMQQFSTGASQLFNGLGNAASEHAGWLGRGEGGLTDGVFNVVGGTAGMLGGLASGLAKGKYENSERILGILGGGLGAIIGVNLFKSMLPKWMQKIPGLGLIMGIAIFLGLGEVISKAAANASSNSAAATGSQTFLPQDVAAASTYTTNIKSDADEVPGATTIVMSDKPAYPEFESIPGVEITEGKDGLKIVVIKDTGDQLIFADNDHDGFYAVQRVADNGNDWVAYDMLKDATAQQSLKREGNVVHVPAELFKDHKLKIESSATDIPGAPNADNDNAEFDTQDVYLKGTGTDGVERVFILSPEDDPDGPGPL